MRLALLGHSLRTGGGVSVGRNLIAALGRVAPQHHYSITIPSGLGYEEVCADLPQCETFVYDHAGGLLARWLFETFKLPGVVAEFAPDVLVGLGNRGLFRPPCPQTVMCHDSHLFYPTSHYGRETLRNRLLMRHHRLHLARALKRCSLLACQTAVAEQRLRRVYGYDGDALIVPNAVSQFVAPPADVPMPEPLRGHEKRFKLFCLTHFYAHKNLEIIPRLFREFAEELKDVLVVLTVAEEQHARAGAFLRDIAAPPVSEHVLNVGPIPQAELAGYFRHCQALFLPTLLESFSGTYIEAMHYGAPILTCDLDFAREVCGDAAQYFAPRDPTSIRDAILALKNDADLQNALVQRGAERRQTFVRSWDDIAAELVKHLEQLAG